MEAVALLVLQSVLNGGEPERMAKTALEKMKAGWLEPSDLRTNSIRRGRIVSASTEHVSKSKGALQAQPIATTAGFPNGGLHGRPRTTETFSR